MEQPNTTDSTVSTTVGKEETGQRILIGLGVGAVLGAVAGAVAVQEMNEKNFASDDDSRTDPLLGAAVGSVVGAGLGALFAAVTAGKRKRRPPPWIPNQVTSEISIHPVWRPVSTQFEEFLPVTSYPFGFRLSGISPQLPK